MDELAARPDLVTLVLYGLIAMPAMLVLSHAYAWLEDHGVNTTMAAGVAGWLLWPAALILIASDVVVVWLVYAKQLPRATAHYRTKR